MLIAGLTASNALLGIPIAVVGLVAGLFAFRSLTPPGTLRLARGLPAAILLRGALTFSFLGADAFVPLALQGWRGESAEVTGIVVTVATLSWTMGSWLQTRRIAQLGPAWFVRVALLMVTMGLIGTSTYLLPQVPIVVGTVFLSFASLGIGLGYSAVSIIVLRNAPPGREGASTSALQLSDVLGTVLGTGLGGRVRRRRRAGRRRGVGGARVDLRDDDPCRRPRVRRIVAAVPRQERARARGSRAGRRRGRGRGGLTDAGRPDACGRLRWPRGRRRRGPDPQGPTARRTPAARRTHVG